MDYRLPAFAEHVGIEILETASDRVVGRILVGPQHIGRNTMVWQTIVRDADNRRIRSSPKRNWCSHSTRDPNVVRYG